MSITVRIAKFNVYVFYSGTNHTNEQCILSDISGDYNIQYDFPGYSCPPPPRPSPDITHSYLCTVYCQHCFPLHK